MRASSPLALVLLLALGVSGQQLSNQSPKSTSPAKKTIVAIENESNDVLTQRAAEELKTFLALPAITTSQTALAFSTGFLEHSVAQEAAIRHLMYLQVKSVDDAQDLILVGFVDGMSLGFSNRPDPGYFFGPGNLSCPGAPTFCNLFSRVDDNVVPTAILSNFSFDPRTRPWYQVADSFRAPRWTPMYLFSGGGLGITFAAPLLDVNGTFVGVVGVDYEIDTLQSSLIDIYGKEGQLVYVVEVDTGGMVASSANDATFQVSGVFQQTQATQSANPKTASSYAFLLEQDQPDGVTYFNEDYVVEALRHTDSFGVDWRIVTVRDVVPSNNDTVDVGSGLSVIVFCLGFFGIVSTLVVGAIMVRNQTLNVWITAHLQLSLFVLAANLLTSVAVLTAVGPMTKELCLVRWWTWSLGLTISILSFLAKMRHVSALARTDMADTEEKVYWTDSIRLVMYPLAAVVITLVITSFVDPVKPTLAFEERGAVVRSSLSCRADSDVGVVVVYAIIAVLFAIGAGMSYASRKFTGPFVDSRGLMFTFYHGAVIFGLVWGLSSQTLAQDQLLTVEAACLFWFTWSSQAALFFPRIWIQLRDGDMELFEADIPKGACVTWGEQPKKPNHVHISSKRLNSKFTSKMTSAASNFMASPRRQSCNIGRVEEMTLPEDDENVQFVV